MKNKEKKLTEKEKKRLEIIMEKRAKLEKDGYITRTRSKEDERVLVVELTKEGAQLKKKASSIPLEVGQCIQLSVDDAKELYRLLYLILNR